MHARPGSSLPVVSLSTDSPAAAGLDQLILHGIAEARVDDAVTARARAHWLAHQAEEDATLAGALCDLAERRASVRLLARGGHLVTGVICDADPTVTIVTAPNATLTIVRTDHVTQVRLAPSRSPQPAPVRRRIPPVAGCRFTDRLRAATAERIDAVVCTADGDVVAGRLRALGQDVLTVLTGDEAAPVLLALATVVAVHGLDPR